MTNPPAGWYSDNEDPGRLRWWDGITWSTMTAARPPEPRLSPSRRWWVPIAVVSTLIVLFALVSWGANGAAGLVIGAALAAFAIAIAGLVKGSVRSFFVSSRPMSAGVLVVSLVLLAVGGAAIPPRPTATSAYEAPAPSTPAAAGRTPSVTASPSPDITTKKVEVVTPVPFESTTVSDPNTDVGATTVTVAGVNGQLTTTFLVTYRDGIETTREQLTAIVSLAPVTQVTAIGQREPVKAPVATCDPNYSGACVPIAADVDCAGGSGNGPAYVSGPVYVTGSDVYDLDRDGDGVACD